MGPDTMAIILNMTFPLETIRNVPKTSAEMSQHNYGKGNSKVHRKFNHKQTSNILYRVRHLFQVSSSAVTITFVRRNNRYGA